MANKLTKNYNLSPKSIFLCAVGIIVLVSLYFGFIKKQPEISSNGNDIARAEAADLINQISSIIRLPEEDPVIATVDNVIKLENQEFFKYAINGDKVFIFTETRRAILYRPQEKRIIEVAYLDLSGLINKNL